MSRRGEYEVGDLQYRPAALADISAMMVINEQSMPENYSYDFWSEILTDDPGLSYVCFSKVAKAIVGYVLVSVSSKTHTRIMSLAVLPSHRRQGIASQLMVSAMAAGVLLYKRGACRLEVRVGNAGAIGMYERLGFVKEERIPEYYGDKEDGWAMVWIAGGPH